MGPIALKDLLAENQRLRALLAAQTQQIEALTMLQRVSSDREARAERLGLGAAPQAQPAQPQTCGRRECSPERCPGLEYCAAVDRAFGVAPAAGATVPVYLAATTAAQRLTDDQLRKIGARRRLWPMMSVAVGRDVLAAAAVVQPQPLGWAVTGCDRIMSEHDAQAEAESIGGTARAFPVYAGAAPVAPQPQTERHLLPVYSVTLKARRHLARDIPRERWGWWGDVAAGQTLKVRDATAADLARCNLDAPRSQNPADYVCEAIHRGALVPREALAEVHSPQPGLFYDANAAGEGAQATGGA